MQYTKCASRCGYKHTPTQTDTDSCLDLDGQPWDGGKFVVLRLFLDILNNYLNDCNTFTAAISYSRAT